jgi:16S rRNA C967 or C1407 C5-methylase (RsmB/RsmF family)/NOL1/NOP2/fmu family ribosome biogenesis protein
MSELPKQFVDRIRHQFPEDAENLLASFDWKPHTSVSLHPIKGQGMFGDEEIVPWMDSGRMLKERPSFTMDPLFHAGCYYPQESSSMILRYILEQVVDSTSLITALDLCASPGGKSLILSDFLEGRGRLISNEVNRARNAVLCENVIKWGCENTIVSCSEASVFSHLTGYFDIILVDAPCSGEGMFRKDLNAREEWSEKNVLICSQRQDSILKEVYSSIKEGGLLIYSTCTFANDENEHTCKRILESGLFESVPIAVEPEWGIHVVNGNSFSALQFLPHKVKGEGFFISVFRKKTNEPFARLKAKTIFKEASSAEKVMLKEWLNRDVNLHIARDESYYCGSFTAKELNELAQHLYITLSGVEIGKPMRNSLIPAHGLALSSSLSENIHQVELNLEDAISFLRGESIRVEGEAGWCVAKYLNKPIGWMKIIQNRMNNYYPKEYRIRMR